MSFYGMRLTARRRLIIARWEVARWVLWHFAPNGRAPWLWQWADSVQRNYWRDVFRAVRP